MIFDEKASRRGFIKKSNFRKFGQMKSRDGKSMQESEKKVRRERVRRNMLQVREKVAKAHQTVFSKDLWLRRVEKQSGGCGAIWPDER